MSHWTAPTAYVGPNAVVEVPGSKSITNRALVLAALATGPSTISGALRSRDTDLMIGALRALGVGLDVDGTTVTVSPAPLHGATIDCGLAGTVMRFVPPVAALATGTSVFDGDDQARTRPQTVILDALRALGSTVTGTSLPFSLEGTGSLGGGTVEIDASGSSQFVSGLLLSAARFDDGLTVRHVGASVPSMPHIEMTVEMLRSAGVAVDESVPASWTVRAGPIAARDVEVEPDLSNATPFLAAAAVTGGRITVPHWPRRTTQPGDAIRGILTAMGVAVEIRETSPGGSSLTVTGTGGLSGLDLDLHDIGELTPTVAALAALADSPSHLFGIAHLRGHETNRLAALVSNIRALGGDASETEDGLKISPATLRGGPWSAFADHRIATAGAIIGLRVPGVEIDDIDTTAKTLPGFTDLWASVLEPTARAL